MKKNEEKKAAANLTEMVFILDRSGSMHGLEEDTIGGFNSMIDKKEKHSFPPSCSVTNRRSSTTVRISRRSNL